MNGDFLRACGHGIEGLDARELCDIAYAAITDDMTKQYYALIAAGATWKDTKDPLGDQISGFEERVGLRDDPAALALELHKKFLKLQGKEWDDTPASGGSGQWWDQETEFTSMSDLDQAAKQRQAGSRNKGLFREK